MISSNNSAANDHITILSVLSFVRNQVGNKNINDYFIMTIS